MDGEQCVICNDGEYEDDKLRSPSSGMQTVQEYGNFFNKEHILANLATMEKGKIFIHVSCQRDIGNAIRGKRKRSKGDGQTVTKMRRRSDEPAPFVCNLHCLYCRKRAVEEGKTKHPDRQGSLFSKPASRDLKQTLAVFTLMTS